MNPRLIGARGDAPGARWLAHARWLKQQAQRKTMKSIVRMFAVALVAIAFTTSALAGDCCKKTAAATKAGKSCEKCVKDSCCKDAAKAVKDAKSCEKCTKAK
jgi:hypothetical protein